MKANLNIYVPRGLLERVEVAAKQADRSKSGFVRRLLEQALTGEQRMHALQEIAAVADTKPSTAAHLAEHERLSTTLSLALRGAQVGPIPTAWNHARRNPATAPINPTTRRKP